MAIEGAVFHKFAKSLDAIARTGYRLPRKVALALSGGVDSVVLLDLLVRYKRSVRSDLEIHAVTVDHGLRPESAREAARLRELVAGRREWPVTHAVLRIGREINRRQLERHARELRYGLLYGYCERHGIGCLLLGHHGDDQLETFVLRLLAGSTLFGLAGMRAVAPGNLEAAHAVDLVRPLLGLSKRELYGHARRHGLAWFEDSTNADAKLTPRNRIRQLLADPLHGETRVDVAALHTRVCALLEECVYARLRRVEAGRGAAATVPAEEDPCVEMAATLDGPLLALTLDIAARRRGVGTIDFLVLDRWIFNQVWQVSPSRRYLYGYTGFDSRHCVIEPTERARSLSELFLQGPRSSGSMTLAGCLFEWERREEDGLIRTRVHVYREHEHRRRVLAAGSEYRVSLGPAEEGRTILYDHRLFLRAGETGAGIGTGTEPALSPAAGVHVQNFNMKDFPTPDRFSPALLEMLTEEAAKRDEQAEQEEKQAGRSQHGRGHGSRSTEGGADGRPPGDTPPRFSAGLKRMLRRLDKAQVPVLCDASGLALSFPTFGSGGGGCRGDAKRPQIALQVRVLPKRRLLV